VTGKDGADMPVNRVAATRSATPGGNGHEPTKRRRANR
jgi:hypothetical protein